MDGRVLHVNISPGGVPKLPVDEALVGTLGLAGDAHHHDWVHGGPHRAVSLFAIEAIDRVRADGHPGVAPGAAGENLTTEGIELARLPLGSRLAVGDEVVLEISGPANPCDVIKGAFAGGKSGRISILLHPDDSRMYARVLREGVVRPNDPITFLPPSRDTAAPVHHELDLLDAVDGEAWAALWRAAAAAGFDVRILDRGDLVAAASPDLPGSVFNRSLGLRLIPIHRPTVEALFRSAGVTGFHVAGADDPTFAGETPESPVGVHVGSIDAALDRSAGAVANAPRGLVIEPVDPTDPAAARRWAEVFIAGFGIEGPIADAWRRLNPILVRSRSYHQFVATLDGRDVAASALFVRRRVAWLGAGTVLPEARGQGIQRALLADRLRRGAEAGARRAMATADLGSTSGRNLDAVGLHRIWTRMLYRFDPSVR